MPPETDSTQTQPALEIHPQMLLLSSRVKHVTYHPFVLCSVDDYLPPEIYQALLEHFPNDEYFVGEVHDQKHSHKRFFTSERNPEVFQEFCGQNLLWRRFFECLSSREFSSDLYRLLRRGLIQSRGLSGLRSWRKADDRAAGWARFWTQPFVPYFEFSQLGAGSHVLPHTDKASKLVSMILYFPHPSWTKDYAGGTGFYRPKSARLERNWANRTVAFEELELWRGFDFVPNRLVVFLKSHNSYHAVPPIRCPEDLRRNTLNFNYIAPDGGLVRFARGCRRRFLHV